MRKCIWFLWIDCYLFFRTWVRICLSKGSSRLEILNSNVDVWQYLLSRNEFYFVVCINSALAKNLFTKTNAFYCMYILRHWQKRCAYYPTDRSISQSCALLAEDMVLNELRKHGLVWHWEQHSSNNVIKIAKIFFKKAIS